MVNDWKESKFGQLADIIMGQSPAGDTCSKMNEGTPLLNGPSEFGSHHPTPVQFTSEPKRNASSGDLLFCVRGSTTGRMNWADQDYAIGRGIAAFRHKHGRQYQPFLRATIEYYLSSMLQAATGSTFPNISKPQLQNLSIKIPPLPEQQRIAHILGTLDDKIELNRQMNETLEAMAQALFKSWFVDFDPVIDKALAAGKEISEPLQERAARRQALGEQRNPLPPKIDSLFPDEFVESELGWIPKGWMVSSLDEIADLVSKSVKPFEEPETIWDHYSIPAFDAGQNPILENGASIMSHKYNVPENSVLISKLNPRTPRIWMPNSGKLFKAVCSTEFLPLVPVIANERPFLWAALSAPNTTKHLLDRVTGTSGSHQRVKSGDIKKLPIINPATSIRALFSTLLEPILQKGLALRNDSKNLRRLRDALLPKLISGEIRVPEAADILAEAVHE